jgi:hypothetical protein
MWRIGIVTVAALVAAGTPAASAGAAVQRTGEPAMVAQSSGPGDATVALTAQDAALNGLCLDASYAGLTAVDPVCSAPSAGAAGDLAPKTLRTSGATVFYGAVSAGTRRVDLVLSNRTIVQAPTTDGRSYGGVHAGRLRFYAVAVKGSPALGGVAARDEDGEARAARDVNPLALPPLRHRATLARVRDEAGKRAAFVVTAARILAPTRAYPGRRRPGLCAGLRAGDVSGRAVCVRGGNRLEMRFSGSCKTGRQIVYGVAPSRVRRATAVLADGGRRAMRVRSVPRRVGRRGSTLLLEIASGEAKAVLAYDAAGRRVATATLSGAGC